MKTIVKTFWTLAIAILSLSILTISCTNTPKEGADSVLVERQVCFLKHFSHLQENDCDMDITVDLPIQGPKVLVDSITNFLNEQLYMYFENGEDVRLPYEEVFSTDILNLVEHYREAYSPYFNEDSTHKCELGTHCLELNMAAQTASYVTYEVVNVFFGEGVEEACSWITFAKYDGHRVNNVITTENMIRFFKEHPNQRSSDVYGDIQYKMENNDIIQLDNVGLLNDSLAFQYIWNIGIYDDFKYDLTMVKPYLSSEAQDLIDKK